jgi:HupE / UreJ protein
MKRAAAAAFAACILLFNGDAFAHRIDEYLQATLLSVRRDRVEGSMRLIPGQLVSQSVIANIDGDGDGFLSDSEQRAYAQRVMSDLSIAAEGRTVQPMLLAWSFPSPAQMREGLGEIHIEFAVDLPPTNGDRRFVLKNRHLSDRSVYLVNVLAQEDPGTHVFAQKRNAQQSTYELEYQQQGVVAAIDRPLSPSRADIWWQSLRLASLYRLGMRHIAEGTDHLLFLLALLLPAPLLASGSRWGAPANVRRASLQILKIVTAFTLGHSMTLMLATIGNPNVPSRPIEILIAVSILISAAHALRPIFPGKESAIAGIFGLIHGLAFAATLDRLGLGLWPRVAGTLSFNLGIETMQLLVVAAVLPSLLMLSRTSAYGVFRLAGAALAGTASMAWTVERVMKLDSRVDPIVDTLARHAPWIGAVLFAASLYCYSVSKRRLRTRTTLATSHVAGPLTRRCGEHDRYRYRSAVNHSARLRPDTDPAQVRSGGCSGSREELALPAVPLSPIEPCISR